MNSPLSVPSSDPQRNPRFFFYAALGTVVVAFLGFTPTYFSPLVRGAFAAPPVVHLHGLIFFTWTLFFACQTWLVSSGRPLRHRDWGLLGISLATAMLFLGLMTAVQATRRAEAAGFLADGKQFMIVPVSSIVGFAILIALAIACVKHKDIHKRLMLVATASILDAAIARWFLTFLAPPPVPGASPVPPLSVTVPPGLLADLFIVAGMVFDWRTRGRIHPVYVWAGGAVLALQLLRVPLAMSPAWDAVAVWLMRVTG